MYLFVKREGKVVLIDLSFLVDSNLALHWFISKLDYLYELLRRNLYNLRHL